MIGVPPSAVQWVPPDPAEAAAATTGAAGAAARAVVAGALGAGSGRVSTRAGAALAIAPVGARSILREVAIFGALPEEKGSEKGSENREASEQPAIRAAAPTATMSRAAARE